MIFIIAFICSCFLTIKVIDLLIIYGFKFNLVDYPDTRKKHSEPKVRIGGLSLIIGIITFLLISLIGFSPAVNLNDNLLKISFIFSLLVYILGFIEDVFTISPIFRLFTQFLIATLAFNTGLVIKFDFLSDIVNTNFLNVMSYLFTCFWLVGGINAINWLDGLDGLASGISSILFLVLSLISFYFGLISLGLVSVATSISTLSFTYKNFYPSRILMGDGGSYFLGFLLSALSIVFINSRGINGELIFENIKYYAPLLLFIYPYFDLLRVVFYRLKEGKSPFLPDRRHLHYIILDKGVSHKNVVISLYGICLLSIIPAIIIIFNQGSKS